MKREILETFFTNPEDAVNFFVQLRELRFPSESGDSIACLKKENAEKWTYELTWTDGRFVGEHIKPFKPSQENIAKFNKGCKGMAELLNRYLDTDDLSAITSLPSPFGDMVYEDKAELAEQTPDEFNLGKLLKSDFDIDFPISGGSGNSRDNPIVIHKVEPNDYTSVEYGVLRCLGIGRGIEWNTINQSVLHEDGRTLDQIKIETKETTEKEVITKIENYYFDITECTDL
ncbi:hypothetical protein ACFL43_02345 [Thermodesulfobacteriota bacterium]